VTDVSFDRPRINPNFDTRVVNCYMGDYNSITAAAPGLGGTDFFMAWGDNRLDGDPGPGVQPDLDVRFEREEVLLEADLSIQMTDSPDPVGVGDELTYRLRIRNLGASDATGVVVTDTLPGNVNFVSASSGCSRSGRTVTCKIGNMSDGETAVRLIRVRPTAPGGFSNTATVTANETDPDPANNTATAATRVR
jgi:uncharacterized repeat protein (TIGR01451 family)